MACPALLPVQRHLIGEAALDEQRRSAGDYAGAKRWIVLVVVGIRFARGSAKAGDGIFHQKPALTAAGRLYAMRLCG